MASSKKKDAPEAFDPAPSEEYAQFSAELKSAPGDDAEKQGVELPADGVMREVRLEGKSKPKPAASRRDHTICKVEGVSSVVSEGKTYQPGEVAEFPDSDVLSLPDILVPVE